MPFLVISGKKPLLLIGEICVFLISVLPNSACAEGLGEGAMGRRSLRALLRHQSTSDNAQTVDMAQKQPYFILTPHYNGTVSLAYRRGASGDISKKRNIYFNAFTRATAFYDEPDCPKPHIPAIFEFVKDVWGKPTYGEFAFFSKSPPSIKCLSASKTLKDLESVVPDIVSAFDEENPRPGVWYNWFNLTDEGKLRVTLLKAVNNADGRLDTMDIWDGTLSPQR